MSTLTCPQPQNRRPAGSPASAGGQFAETARVESGLELDASPPTEPRAGRFAPSVLDPSKVEWIETFDLDPDGALAPEAERRAVIHELDAFGDEWAAEAVDRGRTCCTMCGQPLRYLNVMHHADFGYFVAGTDCAESVGIAAKLNAKVSELRASRKRRAESRKRTAKWEDYLSRDAEFASAVAEGADPDSEEFDPFIADVVATVRHCDGTPTQRQRDAVVRAAARNAECRARKAAEDALPKTPVPAGRQEVSGEVLSVRTENNPFSYGGLVTKMLVRDDRNFKVWMTAPSALLDGDELKGRRVQFTATLEPSADDACFGFGKRPTKAGFLPDQAELGVGGADLRTAE